MENNKRTGGSHLQIKGLEVEIFKGQEKTNRLKFYNSLTKIGDTLSFGLSGQWLMAKLLASSQPNHSDYLVESNRLRLEKFSVPL